MQKRILVLGAGGFVGRRLVTALGAAEWATPIAGVRVLPVAAPKGIEHRILDATRESDLNQALTGVDAVVNCVAGNSASIIESARALFSAAARAPASPRVIHLSTMSVYGDVSGSVDESAALRPELGPYAAAKVAAEQASAAYPNTVILRPGCVYGPGSPQWSARIAELLMARRLGDLAANGDGCCNLVHVDDVVTAITRALQLPEARSAVYNLSTPEPPTWNEYLVRFARALKAVPVRRISPRRLKIEAKLLAPPLKILEMALRIARLRWPVPPAIPPSLLKLMQQEIKLDVRRAEAELGLRWIPLDVGLNDTAGWYLRLKNR
jgi:nucleoside-diphosphate-sugar epimerase